MKKISNTGKKAGFLAALLLAGTLAGCGSKTPGGNSSASSTEVTLNEVAHSIFYAPMYVAIEEGFFEEEGIELTLVTGFGADKTMTAVLTDEAISALWEASPPSILMPEVPRIMLSILPS